MTPSKNKLIVRVTVLDRYVDLAATWPPVDGWGRYLSGRYTIVSLEVYR